MSGSAEREAKTCPDCGVAKLANDFGDNASRADGLAYYCKECFRARANAFYRRKRAAMGLTVREAYDGPVDHKRCAECREVKPLTEFQKSPQQSGGYNCYCKDCRRRQNREAHLKHTSSTPTASALPTSTTWWRSRAVCAPAVGSGSRSTSTTIT